MKRITLDDQGQDFLSFEFDPNNTFPVIQNANMQGNVWNGQIIMNAEEIEEGVFIQISKGFNQEIRTINYPVIDVSNF